MDSDDILRQNDMDNMKKTKLSNTNKPYGTPQLFSILFILLLLLPTALSVFGIASPAGKDNMHVKAPPIEVKSLITPEYYKAWESYVNSRLALSEILAKAKAELRLECFLMFSGTPIFR